EVEIAELVEESPGVGEGDARGIESRVRDGVRVPGFLLRLGLLCVGLGEELLATVFDEADGVDVFLMGGGAVETPGVAGDAEGDLEFLLAGGLEAVGEALGEGGEGGM